MKESMLPSTRRKAGVNDELFYNNAQECSNFKDKSKILEEKMNTTVWLPSSCEVHLD